MSSLTSNVSEQHPERVLHFWFEELSPQQHWVKDPALDTTIREQFLSMHQTAKREGLADWRKTSDGRLAEIIVLDQFSRNIFRDTPESFSCDNLAVRLCKEAVNAGADQSLEAERKAFLYMPLMHSETLEDHHLALELFGQKGLETQLDFERQHLRIIERFGRYPHRNAILGRTSTVEEEAFLLEPGSSF